jgi:hypothetical protein
MVLGIMGKRLFKRYLALRLYPESSGYNNDD